MKRMVIRHARVFPSPVGRYFCFDLCGVGGFVVADHELWSCRWLCGCGAATVPVGVPPFELPKVPNAHAIDSDIRASIA